MNFSTLPKKAVELVSSRITYRMIFILISSFLVIGLTIFALGYRFSYNLEKTESQNLHQKARWLLTSLAQNGRMGVIVADRERMEKAQASILQDADVVYAVYYDQNGKEMYAKFAAGQEKEDFDFPALRPEKTVRLNNLTSLTGLAVLDAVSPIESGLTGNALEVVGFCRVGLSQENLRATQRSLLFIGLMIAVLLLVFMVLITVFLHQMIAKPIVVIADAVKRMGAGERNVSFPIVSNDEIGTLAAAFNEMTKSINDQIGQTNLLVQNLTDTIELIGKTTNDIYSISAQQSSGATEQAASVYEASSTSKEIAASASRITETAEIVAENARLTSGASDEGKVELGNAIIQVKEVSEKVEKVAERMVELGVRSQKISGIIDIINEISEQTNLLSLNAAIEAAGAGGAGRRFSVVAQEIRRLAARTLESTQVVRELVEEIQSATNATVMVTEQSMKSAKDAAEIIERMNLSFQNILELVEKTLNASTEITLSTRQQTTACEQMVTTVMEVSEVASEVEKGAKETEQALAKLRELSGNLQSLIQSRLGTIFSSSS